MKSLKNAILATIIIEALLFFFTRISLSQMIRNRQFDKKYTKIIFDITKDQNIRVYSIDMPEPNAFSVFGKNVYYTTSLQNMLTEKELIAVLLHEFSHYKNKDAMKMYFMTTIPSAIFSIIVGTISKKDAVTFFTSILGRILISCYLKRTKGRKYELRSDSDAAKYGYGKYLISSLKKLDEYLRKQICKNNMSKEECDKLIESMHTLDEHPMLEERIKNILNSSKIKLNLLLGNIKGVFVHTVKSLGI